MKKDKEWLKEQVVHEQNDGLYFRENYSQYDHFVNVEDLLPLINQLDEPEVLSQEWIERNTSPVDDEGRLYIWKRDLQNLIVPKQDELVATYFSPFTELPVMVETETHKYMVEVTKIIETEG